MRKIYLAFFALACSSLSVLAQNPEINIIQGPINQILDGAEMVTIKIPVTNTGNRDLYWKAEEFVEPVHFEKKDSANWLLTSNQDRLTPTVWITRQNSRGIYNQAVESGFVDSSPEGTLWAYGNTADVTLDDYDTWTGTNEWYPLRMLNRPMSIYLPEYNEYLDITLHKWTENARGGGFSYTRSGCAPWLNIEHSSGTVIPGATDTIVIVLDGSLSFGGKYSAEIVIRSNDQTDPEIRIPVSVEVDYDDAEFSASVDEFDFGGVIVSDTVTLPFIITNPGSGQLIINSIIGKSGRFYYSSIPDTLPGNSSTQKLISFSPLKDTLYIDTLIVTTNSTIKPTDTLYVSGIGIPHGILEVDVDTIEFSLVSGETKSVDISLSNSGSAIIEWSLKPSLNKAPVTFTKPNYADYTKPEFQDVISADLSLTRANNEGIFNIAREESFSNGSPANTFWSFGPTRESFIDNYTQWVDAVSSNPPSMVNNPISMLSFPEMKFFDILFKSWTSGSNGGGFSYIRTEVPGWLKSSSYDGILAEAEAVDITISVDAGVVIAGHHEAFLEIVTSNPEQKKILVPVIIDITGEPEMVLDSTSVDFINTLVGDKDSILVKIDNNNLGILEISGFSNELTEFSTLPESLSVLPHYSGFVTVYFSPSEAGEYKDTLWISSNFSDSALYALPLYGNAALPPVMSVLAEPISDTLNVGETSVRAITIKNTGDSDLNWTITPELPASMVMFTKPNWSDWTLPENQDQITENIIITRADNQGLFNIAEEDSYSWDYSPAGTLWRMGTSNEEDLINYAEWRSAVSSNPPSMVDNTISMFLPEEFRFFDIKFHSWTDNGLGGGFSYTRTEIPVWLKATEYSGTVAPDDSIIVGIVLDAQSKTGGKYFASISVEGNGPQAQKTTIPVEMLVTGIPEIAVPGSIDFGTVINSVPIIHEVPITNDGTDTLRISSMSANGAFSAIGGPVVVAPNKSKGFELTFILQQTGTIQDTLIVESNSPTTPVAKIPLEAIVITNPITITPAELNYRLPSDTIVYDSIMIKNISEGDVWLVTGTLAPGDSIDYLINVITDNLTDSTYDSFINVPVTIPDVINYMHQIPLTVEVFNFKELDEYTDTTVNEGFGLIEIDLASKYETYRGNTPSFLVISSNTDVADASIVNNILQITETGTGQSMITVRADDNFGHIIYSDFVLLNNSAPVVTSIPDRTNSEGFVSEVISLSEYFTDAENQSLTFEASSSNTGVVTVSVSGTNLTVTETGIGTSTISVTATDPYGLNVSDEFAFTVNEVTGLQEYSSDHVVVYPNPSSGIIHARFKVSAPEQVTIKITDINGRIVYSSVNTIDSEPVTLDLSALDKGLYIMNYTIKGKLNFTKINLTE